MKTRDGNEVEVSLPRSASYRFSGPVYDKERASWRVEVYTDMLMPRPSMKS